MEINGLTIPDEGTTTQYIADKVGGWLYKADTTITVTQLPLDYVDKHIVAIQAQLADFQAAKADIEAAVAQVAPIDTL